MITKKELHSAYGLNQEFFLQISKFHFIESEKTRLCDKLTKTEINL